jgi:amidase
MELTSFSATTLARFIRTNLVSSVAVVDAHLARLEAVNPKLNAVIQLQAEAARQQARAADEAVSRGERLGPLHGIPITLKDSLDTADMVSTWGTAGRADFTPEHDATVVTRLRAAGAIILGKTNTPEFTLAGITNNDVYGRTNNPYDVERSPAGSSGGAGAILAAGGSALDLGSDTGGSIRMPSHYCGIAGIKPTSGRVPRTGHAISFEVGALDAFTQIGPMARHVEDLNLVLSIIAGPDGHDPAVVPAPLGDSQDVSVRDLRVAFFTDNGIKSPSPDTVSTVRAAASVLADHGVSVTEDRPQGVSDAERLWYSLYLADGGAWIRQLIHAAGTEHMSSALDWMQTAQPVSLTEFTQEMSRWNSYRGEMLAFMEPYDVLLCPVSATPATRHDDPDGPDFTYTFAHNLTGWPGAVVRCGASTEGLPIGVQIVARPWREDVALAVAHYLETNLGGWQSPAV